MATSVIEICNRALRAIGEKTITSLSDESTRSSLCSLHYEPVRDAVIRAHPWKFATQRTNLAVSSTPAFEFDYAYQLPSDCLRLLAIYNNSGTRIDTEGSWTLEGREVFTDAEAPIYIRYLKRVEDPTKHDTLFDEALIARLAATMADDRSKEQAVVDRQWDLYTRKIAEAQYVDSTESSIPEEYVSAWESARA